MLLVFTAAMAMARPALLTGGFAFLLLLYVLAGIPSPATLAHMLKRLRWLLLAILLVYGWWTPGVSLWPDAGALSPTIEGLYLGMLRVLALMAIVAAVHLLLQSTPREELLPAIMQLIRPFTTRHVRERIAVRTLLSIEAVAQVQSLASDVLREHPVTARNLSNLARASQLLYKNVLDRADHAGNALIEVRVLTAPPWWQWIIPLAMSGVILIVV
jgi:energy-coupling factor transport system permease protein